MLKNISKDLKLFNNNNKKSIIKISSNKLHLNQYNEINFNQKTTSATSTNKLPKSTKVLICGGGLIGVSVAYHLTQLGYKDIVLVTRNK
jgi:monoamine oxidase